MNDALSIDDLRASGSNIFNQVDLGLLMLHGTYGTSPDYTANAAQQMYFPITAGLSAQYLRMSEMNLGNSATNGLKWMAIMACNSLYEPNWLNMVNQGVNPNNGNLHLILGTDSISYTDTHIMGKWATYMNKGTNGTPLTIKNAWIEAAKDSYDNGYNYPIAMRFAVAGDEACQDDTLQTNSPPSGVPFYISTQVFPR